MWFLCHDKMEELETVMREKQEQLQKLKETKVQELWTLELDQVQLQFEKDLKKHFAYSVGLKNDSP
jgi:hypothetical protein